MQSSGADPARHDLSSYGLKVSAYDRVASMLISVLILTSLTVAILLVLWFTSRYLARQTSVPVQMEEIGTGEGPLGDSEDFDPPTVDADDFQEPMLENTLTAISDAVAEQAALLADPALGEAMKSTGRATGEGRLKGTGGDGIPGTPRHWEVRFLEGGSLGDYARQLEHFAIELAIILPDNQIGYAYNLTKPTPDRRIGDADEEKRYYLTWRQGELEQADRELLTRAGLDPGERLILKFISPPVEAELVQLERDRAGSNAERVHTTYFEIVPEGTGYRFRIDRQSLR